MNVAASHLVIVPVLLPLVAGALMLPLSERRHALKGAISIISASLLLACAWLCATPAAAWSLCEAYISA